MERTLLFDKGALITKAEFLGFFNKENPKKCNHRSCGFRDQKVFGCPKCGMEWDRLEWRKPPKFCPKCKTKLKIFLPTGKVKCKSTRWRIISTEKMCDPEQEIRYAAIEVLVIYGERLKESIIVIDMTNNKFVNGDWMANSAGTLTLYEGRHHKIDVKTIINKNEIFQAIQEKILGGK